MNLINFLALDWLDWYKTNEDILTNSGFVWDILREIGWAIVKFLAIVCQACETLLIKAYGLIDFITNSGVGEMIEKWKGVYVVLLAISIMIFGLTKIINPEEKNTRIVGNFFLFIGVTCLLSVGMVEGNNLMKNGIALSNSVNATASSPILGTISDNVISLKRCYDNYWENDEPKIDKSNEDIKGINGLSSDDILLLDPTTVYIPNADKEIHLLDHYFDSSTGTKSKTKISEEEGLFGLGEPEYYYMYSIDYLSIYIYLIAMIMAYVFSAYKACRIIYELAIHKILAFIHAPMDLNNGQKIKKILLGIVNSYVVLIAISLFIKIFNIYNNYLNGRTDLTPLEKSLFILFGAFALIDGPNLIEQLYGIDAGLSSGYKMIRGLAEAARGAKDIGSGAMNLAHEARNMTTSAAGNVGGSAAGTVGAIWDNIRGRNAGGSDSSGNSLSKMSAEDSSASPSQNARSRNSQESESRRNSTADTRQQQNSSSTNRQNSTADSRQQQNNSSERNQNSSANNSHQQSNTSDSSHRNNDRNENSHHADNSQHSDNRILSNLNQQEQENQRSGQNEKGSESYNGYNGPISSSEQRQDSSSDNNTAPTTQNQANSNVGQNEPETERTGGYNDRSSFDMYDEDLHKKNQNDYNQMFDSPADKNKNAEGNNFRDLVNNSSSREEFRQNYSGETMSDYIRNRRSERSTNPTTNSGQHFEDHYRTGYRRTNAVMNTIRNFRNRKKK